MSVIKERLILLRKEHRLTQEDVAKAIQIAPRGYQNYESGKYDPSASSLIALADFYSVSVDFLLGRTETREVNR